MTKEKTKVRQKTLFIHYSLRGSFLITLCIILTFCIASSFFLYYHFFNRSREASLDSFAYGSRMLVTSVQDTLQSYSSKITRYTNQDDVRRFVSTDFEKSSAEANAAGQTLISENPYLVNLVFQTEDEQIYSFASVDYLYKLLQTFNSEAADSIATSVSPYYILIFPIYNETYEQICGRIFAVIDCDAFMQSIKSLRISDSMECMLVYHEKPVYNIGFIPESRQSFPSKVSASESIKISDVTGDDGGYYVTHTSLSKYNMTVCSVIPKSVISNNLLGGLMWLMIIWAVIIISLVIVILRVFSNLNKEYAHLQDYTGHIINSEINVTEDFSVNEIRNIAVIVSGIANDIRALSNKTLELEKQDLEKELINRQAKFNALKNQINPHFINNTLAYIKSLALDSGNVRISEICSSTSKILRYCLSESSTATVEEEIENIEAYLLIQNYRFGNNIDYKIAVDKSIYNCRTIRFFLQPVVENAIIHGLEPQKSEGKIVISGVKKDDHIIFEIIDTGNGIPPHILQQIQSRLDSEAGFVSTDDSVSKNTGIGLTNIHNRIKLMYGKEYGIQINSTFGVGTFITIKLPIIN